MFNIFSASVIDKSNNIVCGSFNVGALNEFPIITRKDCFNMSVQNYMYIKEDHCYAKEETQHLPNTNSSLLCSVKKKITSFQDNDDNYQLHNTE